MSASKHEVALEAALAVYGRDLPPYDREAALIPGRKFRFDFAWREQRLAVEIQGGTFGAGRSAHTGASLIRDHEKANLAAIYGWRIVYLNARNMTKRALPEAVETIRRALKEEA